MLSVNDSYEVLRLGNITKTDTSYMVVLYMCRHLYPDSLPVTFTSALVLQQQFTARESPVLKFDAVYNVC